MNQKIEVDSCLFILFGIEDLQQASYSYGSLLFYFSNSDIGFIALNKNWTIHIPVKKQNISMKRKTNKK